MAHIGHGRTPSLDAVLLRLKSFLCLCAAVFLCCTAPAARLQGRAPGLRPETRPESRQEPARRLAYRFDFGHVGKVHVTLETTSPASGAELLELPSIWADAHSLEHAIENLKITGSEVSLEPTGRPSRLNLRAKPGTTMQLDYDLVQDWTGPFRADKRHRVLLRPDLVEFNGENGLIAPRMDGTAAVQVSFDFIHLVAGQSLVTSFGTEAHQAMRGPWSEVANALFVAGELSTRQSTVLGGPVLLAVAGHWSFSEQEMSLKVHEILGAERSFWQTPVPPWYAVVLAPYEAGTSGGGGSAFTHAFSLTLAPGEHFGPETESLFAHEAFHAWNPSSLGPVADAVKLAWFVEGVTTYYQDLLLERGRLIDRVTYLKRVNALLRETLSSPALAASESEQATSLDDDEVRYRAPYLRGAVIALWLNAEIVRATAGRASLDDVMRGLLAGSGQPLTNERIFVEVGHFVDAATVGRLRGFAEGRADVPVGAESLGECVVLRPTPAWTFALGLPPSLLVRGAALHDVDPQSAAFRAGLRDGQVMMGWSLWYGDADHEVVLSVRAAEGDAVERIRYLPRGRQIEIPQAELRAGCAAGLD